MIIYQWKNRPRKYDEIKATHLLWSDRMSENEDFRDDDSDGDEDVKGRQILNYMVDDFRVFFKSGRGRWGPAAAWLKWPEMNLY